MDQSRVIKYEHQLAKHKKAHIEYENLKLLSTETTPARDPRKYPNGKMWRDAICKQLNFEELLVDFLTSTILLEGSKAIQRQVYDYNHLKVIFLWNKTVKIISTDKNAKVMLIYTLWVIEKEEFKYKHHRPLLAILNNIVWIDNNDAAMQLLPSPASAISSGTTISPT